MATPDFLEWLAHEEEIFGLTGAIERTIDPEACRRMLLEELGYDPTEAQVKAMYEAGRYKYETLPQLGLGTEVVTTYRGTIREQTVLWYRDIATGRRISLADVQYRIELMGLR